MLASASYMAPALNSGREWGDTVVKKDLHTIREGDGKVEGAAGRSGAAQDWQTPINSTAAYKATVGLPSSSTPTFAFHGAAKNGMLHIATGVGCIFRMCKDFVIILS